MTFLDFPIGDDDIDRRIDRVIRKFLKHLPLSAVYKNIRSGFIRVNNAKVKNDYRMIKGDSINIEHNFYNASTSIQDSSDDVCTQSLPQIKYDTIFENEHIRVINKPYGVNVQASHANDISLDKLVREDYKKMQNTFKVPSSLSFVPGPLHRLDKNTTGVLAFSQSLQGARYFSESMQNHSIKKHYLCILSGTLNESTYWNHSIQKEQKRGTGSFVTVNVQETVYEQTHLKSATTIVTPIAHAKYNDENITLARISIETGRTHQIRSQAAFCNYPLLGDTAYGYKGSMNHFFLHAWVLEFPRDNPIKLPEKLIAELPYSFKEFVKNHLPNTAIPSYNSSR